MIKLGFLAVVFLSLAAQAAPMKLVWSDEFNYTGKPDLLKWEFELGGGGWGNDELEYYTDRLENARVENGHLIIEARKEDFHENHYTSARMHARGPGWKYGRIDIRAKMAHGEGTWSALWMLAAQQTYSDRIWPDNGEMDIVEYVGRDPKNIIGCFYTKNFNWMLGTGKTLSHPVRHADSAFHVYTLEWNENEATISVDGVKFNNFKNPHTDWGDWPLDQNYYLIMNLALGGYGGDVDDKIFPQKMLVDYVRVYQPVEQCN